MKKKNPIKNETDNSQPKVSWQDIYEIYEDVPDRLGGQEGYRLFTGNVISSLSPTPRLKSGVELILEELEKSKQSRNQSAIAAGMAMMDEKVLKDIKGLPDETSRIILLKAYDPRFGYISADLQASLFDLLIKKQGRQKSAERRKVETYCRKNKNEIQEMLKTEKRSMVITNTLRRIFGQSSLKHTEKRRLVRIVFSEEFPTTKDSNSVKSKK